MPGVDIVHPREANAVFAALPPRITEALRARGWLFYHRRGPRHAARLMCSWDTTDEDVALFLRNVAEDS